MRRLSGSILGAVLVLVVGSSANAQVPAGNLGGMGAYGGYAGAVQPYGGFGYDYVQTVPANTYVLDQWWMLTPTPTVATAPAPVAATQPAPAVRPAPAAQPAASARRSGLRRFFNWSTAQRTYQLPTGSLDWAGAGAIAVYAPAQRYESYDAGYGRSPYGSVDYGMTYKGYAWGY
jgi:hypothetical protein